MMDKALSRWFAVPFVALWVSTLSAEPQSRPKNWAQPISCAAIKKFYRIDEKVYRSAQPDREGFEALRKQGIRNILNLRDHHSDDSKARGMGLNLYRVEMGARKIKTEDVVAALRIIKKSEGPVVVHCWHGSDRTGAVIAMYRVVFQNWPKEAALEELMNGGYGYHSIYKNIPEFIRAVDIDDIRMRVLVP